ncbi:MAG: hypothetical protein H6774_00410 [Pseudomonadales bacterium]|nr:hypothetical protein [Pseudomonadales bacterium]
MSDVYQIELGANAGRYIASQIDFSLSYGQSPDTAIYQYGSEHLPVAQKIRELFEGKSGGDVEVLFTTNSENGGRITLNGKMLRLLVMYINSHGFDEETQTYTKGETTSALSGVVVFSQKNAKVLPS